MSDYRRVYTKGGTYFFTLVTHQRKPFFNNPQIVKRLRDTIEYTEIEIPFLLKASIVLPDGIHIVKSDSVCRGSLSSLLVLLPVASSHNRRLKTGGPGVS